MTYSPTLAELHHRDPDAALRIADESEKARRCEEIDRRRTETLRAIDERRAASLAALETRRAG